jgi:hypothetical protein
VASDRRGTRVQRQLTFGGHGCHLTCYVATFHEYGLRCYIEQGNLCETPNNAIQLGVNMVWPPFIRFGLPFGFQPSQKPGNLGSFASQSIDQDARDRLIIDWILDLDSSSIDSVIVPVIVNEVSILPHLKPTSEILPSRPF